ncbi:MAG: polysaccharide pyruvyl transferase family protein, partial [Pseudomonadota bacterium]
MRRPHPYINVGDALSPVMVALVSGRPVRRVGMARHGRDPAASAGERPDRMAAIGTIGQNLRRGTVVAWGTGCSPHANPLEPGPKRPYAPPGDTRLVLAATRGPYAARLLAGGAPPAIPHGDPALLLPLFHRPPVAARHALGVVLHLSELADRGFEAVAKPGLARYAPAPGEGVRLITMVAPPGIDAIADKIDEIRACRRIVSTSLHGIAIALAYGIPCLYLGAGPGGAGLREAALDPGGAAWPQGVNARFPDLYAGLGAGRMAWWCQPKGERTDWARLAAAVEREGDAGW